MPFPFNRPESLEQMLDRQRRTARPPETIMPASFHSAPDMRVDDGKSKLRPTPMTPLMRKRLEEMQIQYTP